MYVVRRSDLLHTAGSQAATAVNHARVQQPYQHFGSRDVTLESLRGLHDLSAHYELKWRLGSARCV